MRVAGSEEFTESEVERPGALAPRTRLFLEGGTPAAVRRRVEVGGVRRRKWKVRSGRTVMSAGMGVPGVMWEVSALNSCLVCVLVVGFEVVCEGGGEDNNGKGDERDAAYFAEVY